MRISKFILEYQQNKILILLFALLVSFFFKIFFLSYPFFGLEYEDAFIYSDVSRYLLFNYDWSLYPFQTKSCVDGSLNECYEYTSYGGHYMILPLIVSLAHKIFGYIPSNMFVVNLLSSLITLLYFIKILKILDVRQSNMIFAIILYITVPFLNIFNTSGLAETLSSTCIMISLFYFTKSYKENFTFKSSAYWLFLIFVFMSILTKRENLIFILLPLLSFILLLLEKNISKINIYKLLVLFVALLGFALLSNAIIGIQGMEQMEGEDIGTSTFSINNFKVLFPLFITSFINVNYFGITGIVFLITTLSFIFYKRKFEFRLSLILAWLYLILYSAHYRSYYQVHFGDVNIFDTLRYSSNYFPIACISMSTINIPFSKIFLNNNLKIISLSVAFFYFLVILFFNFKTRKELSTIEYEERIEPTLITLNYVSNSDYILTDIPSVFHIFQEPNINIIDYYVIKEETIKDLKIIQKTGNIFLLLRLDNANDIERYPDFFNYLKDFNLSRISKISENYALYKLTL